MPNRVLNKNFKVSTNFFDSDLVLRHFLDTNLSARSFSFVYDKLLELGSLSAGELNELSLTADKNSPELVKRNFYGETIDQIKFHPAYDRMVQIAVESNMFRLKWEPELRARFTGERNKMSFSLGFLFAMSESGVYCPLCMTDGVAVLIDKFCSESDKERLLPRVFTEHFADFYTGAMFLTEKSGGSDVGSNETIATHFSGDQWLLSGEKWFCSNAGADIIFALARTKADVSGTKGLGIFLLEPGLKDGSKNNMELIRLKDKLGTRSMASGEYILNDAVATLVGNDTDGFKIMTEMINLSRLYNSVAAIAGMRRGIVEAYQFLSFRNTFGKIALEHALIRTKFYELAALYLGNFYACWRAIDASDAMESGVDEERELLRFLTPMIKKSTAEASVYAVRESMELMGGIGYIEDGVLPKIMRDVMVLPIWEGSGNIMILDMLRAMIKSNRLQLLIAEMELNFKSLTEISSLDAKKIPDYKPLLNSISKLSNLDKDTMEASAKPLFEKLTSFYQLSCLIRYRDEMSSVWIDPAILYYLDKLGQHLSEDLISPPSVETIKNMIAWDF